MFGLLLVVRRGAGALAILWLIGAFAIAFGVVSVILAFRLRALKTRLESPGSAERRLGMA